MVLALAQPQNTADGLFTLSPVPTTCKSAPVPWNPRPPLMRKPFMLDAAAVVKELALRAVVLVIVACFPFNAVATFTPAIVTAATLKLLFVVSTSCFAAMVVAMSTPLKYSWGANRLDWTMAEPDISMEGALKGALQTILPAEMPRRSTLFESASDNVPDAGLIRAHVRVPTVTRDELVSAACFPASSLDRLVTSEIAIGPLDCCA